MSIVEAEKINESNYQENSTSFAAPITDEVVARIDKRAVAILHGILGVAGELGEIESAFVNADFDHTKIDYVNLAEEIGDVSWYIAYLSESINYNPKWKRTEIQVSKNKIDTMEFYFHTKDLLIISSEIIDSFKRYVYYGVDICEETMKERIDKVILIVNKLASSISMEVEYVLSKNIAKLDLRFKQRQFTEKSATERDLEAERNALES